MTPRAIHPRVLTKTEAAAYLGLSDEAFGRHVAPSVAPLPLGKTRATLYDRNDLDNWLDGIKCQEKLQGSTSTQAPAAGSSTSSTEAPESLKGLLSAASSGKRQSRGFTNSLRRQAPSEPR